MRKCQAMSNDFYIPVLNAKKEKIMDFIKKIKDSNIEKEVQDELIRLLHTAIDQIKQFKAYGWL